LRGAGAPTLRPVTAQDRPFLARLYASTREEELAAVPFTPEQRAAFLDQQFDAQTRHYATAYVGASFDVVEVDGQDAGRLIVARRPGELRVVDIALLPEHRGRGLGTRLLQPVLAEADARGVPTTLHVETHNPAQRWYARLGFRPVGQEGGVHRLLERPPLARRAARSTDPQAKTAS
jgi:ribosomal protein S18 acetylase RimI-like enzyme